MITTFLDVEKMSAGQMELRLESIELADFIGAVVERARPLAERKQIQIITEVQDGTTLSADRELMEYVLYNLLTNAIQSTRPRQAGLHRRRGASRCGHAHSSGQRIGMDEDDLKHLFTRFFRPSAPCRAARPVPASAW